jgi:tRNA (guanine-N7-)-methyltransferase
LIERIEIATAEGVTRLEAAGARSELEALLPGDGPWELEIGCGKGRFLLSRAAAAPDHRFLGIELAGEYFRRVAGRLARRGLGNVALIHGEALALLATALPRGFASALHVYFPDPWPKSRHHRRRLFSPASVDLLLAALAPGGELFIATDHLDYGAEVARILRGYPGAEVQELPDGWPEGPRTNYEAKYVGQGRPILRLRVGAPAAAALHPEGARAVLAAVPAPAPPGDGSET